jgi:hypothetical protein
MTDIDAADRLLAHSSGGPFGTLKIGFLPTSFQKPEGGTSPPWRETPVRFGFPCVKLKSW